MLLSKENIFPVRVTTKVPLKDVPSCLKIRCETPTSLKYLTRAVLVKLVEKILLILVEVLLNSEDLSTFFAVKAFIPVTGSIEVDKFKV